MIANLGNPADLSDSAALEHERDASDALLHEAIWRDDESRQWLANVSHPLLLRIRIQRIDSAGQVSNRTDYGTPDDDGWVEIALPGWPQRASYGVGMLEPDGSTSTHIEVQLVSGPPLPTGAVPGIVSDGENDSELLTSASVVFAIFNTVFLFAVLVATYLALVAWTNKPRGLDALGRNS